MSRTDETRVATIFAVEVLHPLNGWTRLEGRYRTKACARSWYSFIKKAWHGCRVRTVEIKAEKRA